jgi:hypothetical protein
VEQVTGGTTMKFRCAFVLGLMVSLSVVAQGIGGEERPVPATWQEAAQQSGLSEDGIVALENNRILITNDAYKQIFTPYLSGQNPLFITSDSLLNAYHVLYEESIFKLECVMAKRLPDILRLILQNMELTDDYYRGNPELVAAARKRALLVTGIALKLVDDSFQFEDVELDTIMEQEFDRIVNAEGSLLPSWLGEPDASFMEIDYSRYKPRGFYTRSEELMRYFRAVSWLQSIPFRVSKDEELLSILLLGYSVTYRRFEDHQKQQDMQSFFRAYTSFIGAGDDWDLMTAAQEAQNPLESGEFQEVRSSLIRMANNHDKGPLINDQIRFAPSEPEGVAEPNFRIISAYRTPSAILFQRTTDIRKFDRAYPNGLEVAASLGSAFAQNSLQDPQKEALLETIASCQTYFNGDSLYFEYLDALKTLLDTPEPDAPDFMAGEFWQAKSCNTVLAGWAQLRHTWALHAKQTANFLGGTIVPEGFVEPEPEFFSRMASLAESSRKLLSSNGAFDQDYSSLIAALEEYRDILETVKDKNEYRELLGGWFENHREFSGLPSMVMGMERPRTEDGIMTFYKEQAKKFDSLVADIKEGKTDEKPELKIILKMFMHDLAELWQRLEQVSRRLESIAHKQLRQVELNDDDIGFVKGYGITIARIMLYGGNSYLNPRDDAPKVVDVYANSGAGRYLHVGIARPRKMYVLYPWQGKPILCEGAVMPYYEFVNASRLTDEEWIAKLDSDERPPIPEWISPVVCGGNLDRLNLQEEH